MSNPIVLTVEPNRFTCTDQEGADLTETTHKVRTVAFKDGDKLCRGFVVYEDATDELAKDAASLKPLFAPTKELKREAAPKPKPEPAAAPSE